MPTKAYPHREERPEGASRRTRHRDAALGLNSLAASQHVEAAAVGGKAESILTAASRTFLAKGFGAVSMDTIAREASVSKATVYAHFAGKEELFGAMVGRVCERHFETFTAGELDPRDVRASLTTLGRRFLELVLSPDAIAVHRIIVAEVTRSPELGEVFWRAGPERTLGQIEAFMRAAGAAGTIEVRDARLAAEQFIGLMRGENHLRHLFRLEPEASGRKIRDAAAAAVDTFIRAFAAPALAPSSCRRRSSERHAGVAPAFDVAADAPNGAVHVLDDVGAGERAPELHGQAEAEDGEDRRAPRGYSRRRRARRARAAGPSSRSGAWTCRHHPVPRPGAAPS